VKTVVISNDIVCPISRKSLTLSAPTAQCSISTYIGSCVLLTILKPWLLGLCGLFWTIFTWLHQFLAAFVAYLFALLVKTLYRFYLFELFLSVCHQSIFASISGTFNWYQLQTHLHIDKTFEIKLCSVSLTFDFGCQTVQSY